MKKNLQPIAVANGDGGTGRVAPMILESVFSPFPFVDVPLTVAERIKTNDACIEDAVRAFLQCGAGFKNSTASDHPDIKRLGMKSANIVMRPMTGAFAMLRLLQGPGRYVKACGTLRYAHGSFYDEVSCTEEMIDGRRTAVITQHLDLQDLQPFAMLAMEIAQQHGLDLLLSSKSTIATSELWFRRMIEEVWKGQGLTWTHKLTDIAIAELPVQTALGGSGKGGFLHVADNANGDTSSDVIDHQHGNFVMGSTVFCLSQDGRRFSYEELPGGTAHRMEFGPLIGDTFLNPTAIMFALTNAFQQVNPDQNLFFEQVRYLTIQYLNETPKQDRDTEEMIKFVAEGSQALLV
jgi:hypothetical protein